MSQKEQKSMASWKGPNPFKHPKSSNRRYSWVDRTGNAHENQRFKLREVTQLIQHATYLHPGKISIKMLNSIRNELERTEFCLKLQSSREKFFILSPTKLFKNKIANNRTNFRGIIRTQIWYDIFCKINSF